MRWYIHLPTTTVILIWIQLPTIRCSNKTSLKLLNVNRFPDGFLFGIGTSAYQIEGSWNVSDKSENIWDRAVHTEPYTLRSTDTGDIACDSYNQYERDIEMLSQIGVNYYRFSISWTRILPTGFPNYISKDGVAFYNKVINELLKNNIRPVITLYHWDLPQSLQDLGGWLNPLIVSWFADYARVVFKLFGDRVKDWLTLNEPLQHCFLGYETTGHSPYLNLSGVGCYLCSHYQLKAHAAAYHTYDKDFRPKQKGRIGITIQMVYGEAASNSIDDIQAAEDYNQFMTGLYCNPIFGSGDYPSIVKEKVAAKSAKQGFIRSRLPEFTQDEIKYIKGTSDFFGLNQYVAYMVYRNSSVSGIYETPSFYDDFDVAFFLDATWASTGSDQMKVVPWAMRKSLNFIKHHYNNPEIHIEENGFPGTGGLEDSDRIDYLKSYMKEVLNSIHDDKINVTRYAIWSLMDSFEWAYGYKLGFGLFEVDFADPQRKRTIRKSGLAYKELIKTRVLDNF